VVGQALFPHAKDDRAALSDSRTAESNTTVHRTPCSRLSLAEMTTVLSSANTRLRTSRKDSCGTALRLLPLRIRNRRRV
jgi:hypothetical protein